MTISLPVVLGVLAAVFAAAVALGLLIHRAGSRQISEGHGSPLGSEGMSGALGFVGGAAAFLLGVLMLASVDHYNATKATAGDEALAYAAAFDSTAGLASPDAAKIQRDLICLMRSVATNSWTAAEIHDLTGSDNSHSWRKRAFNDANATEPKTKVQENSLAILQDELINASKTGQQRLLAAESDLPLALWILVYVSIFVLTVILTSLLRAHASRLYAVAALTAVLILSAAMLWTLTAFAEPFSRDGVYIAPRALDAVMVRMQGTYPDANWGPCEVLADN